MEPERAAGESECAPVAISHMQRSAVRIDGTTRVAPGESHPTDVRRRSGLRARRGAADRRAALAPFVYGGTVRKSKSRRRADIIC